MSVIEYLVFGAVLITLVAGAAAITSLAFGHMRQVWQLRRGVPTQVWCPRHQQETLVRIGVPPGGTRLHVLWCERQPGDTLRCDASCFPMLDTIQPHRAEPAKV